LNEPQGYMTSLAI